MPRYFIELAYKGTAYSGFQTQENANTIQAEVEKAFSILQRSSVTMTGSSRTDAGVHAKQNFLHFDFEEEINPHFIYKMNAILPSDIVIRSLQVVRPEAHCRFDALYREYEYCIYNQKDPFMQDRAFFFPYRIDFQKLQQGAELLKHYNDFSSFSKRNTQVKSFQCEIIESKWIQSDNGLIYNVKANRFLRGMVRALTATMLLLGRNKLTVNDFTEIIEARDCTRASFAVPPQGLFLKEVNFPESIYDQDR
ncbi:MAG TPA: tRNA pseudouridine(38-40) synthase TruA [Chitinophagaceae bacterium]|nr:tRNA pseudouridine(38-40) synthase TruA [Chitinophagaceae bacterium]